VDWDTPVSRTPTVAPRSLARECALLRERRARGPQKLLGPPTARVNARSEDHVKMQRLRTRGMTAAGETKWRATQQSPRRQNRHDGASLRYRALRQCFDSRAEI
jgi:hypothetical protein